MFKTGAVNKRLVIGLGILQSPSHKLEEDQRCFGAGCYLLLWCNPLPAPAMDNPGDGICNYALPGLFIKPDQCYDTEPKGK